MTQSFPTILATTSEKKRAEWNAISTQLRGTDAPQFTLLDQKVGFAEPATLKTVEVAVMKALHAFRKLGKPVLVEDSAFHIEALGGFPGPLYAQTEKTLTNAGLCWLLDRLGGSRNCNAVVSISFTNDGETVYVVQGMLHGTVPSEPLGPDTFGYDNILIPTGEHLTLAQLGPEKKNQISMRRRAIENLLGNVWTPYPAKDCVLY